MSISTLFVMGQGADRVINLLAHSFRTHLNLSIHVVNPRFDSENVYK